MENENKSASEILDEAASLLEEENKWGQRTYARKTDSGCVMCAHGAIAYCGNSAVKKIIDNNGYVNTSLISAHAAIAGAVRRHELQHPPNEGVRQNPLKLAHFTAAQVGLTFGYNDAPTTTQADVVRKLRSAAQIARNNYGE